MIKFICLRNLKGHWRLGGGEIGGEEEECEKPKVMTDPGQPTEKEIEEHRLDHTPYRSWCPVCVEAQGREDPHYRGTKEDIINEPVI